MKAFRSGLLLTLFILCSCSSTSQVDLKEPAHLAGREGDVRVEAQLFAQSITPNAMVHVAYDITNERAAPIAIADMILDSTYDPESRTITINIGSEVPGNDILPRLIRIKPGEKKSFAGGARMPIVNMLIGSTTPYPRYLRLIVHFLGDDKPFDKLVDIPEKAVHDRALAAALFPRWVESSESVGTNAIPINWSNDPEGSAPAAGARRRRHG